MVKRVCLVSSGTGGHLMPAVVLADALRKSGFETLLVTEGRDVEREFLDRAPGDSGDEGRQHVDLLGGQRGSRLGVLGLPIWLMRATVHARRMLRAKSIDVVVSTGGRTSLPVGLAARSLGMPLFLLEQNATTGRANRWLMPFARRLYQGLPPVHGGHSRRALLTGTPLRPELFSVDVRTARAQLGLRADTPVVLVTGGSQGAQTLNTVVPQALCQLPFGVQVLHLSGIEHDAEVRLAYDSGRDRGLTARVRPMAMDMDRMYGAADLVICRGGGGTVSELMAAGRAALIVPYPHHRDRQQYHNARVLECAGAAVIVEEDDLSVSGLTELITGLLMSRQRLRSMGDAARSLALVDPCDRILADLASAAETS